MSPRWSWDFEEERKPAARRPAPEPPPPAGPGATNASREAQIRRRRVGALAILAAVIVIAIAAASGSSHGHRTATVAAGGPPHVTHRTSGEDEKDGLAAVHKVLGYTPFVREGGGHAREIALTFDDGPGPYTPEVLSVLEREHVKATFFAVGRMLRYFGASTVREFEDGDVIGDHTEDHPMLATLSAHDQYEELFEQLARIEVLGGSRPVLFRPPYGSFDPTTLHLLAKLHLLMVLWSADTNDYEAPGVTTIVERAMEGAHPGAIILMHDGGGNRSETVAALPLIITKLRAAGYRLVTVPQLLADDPPPAGQALPTKLSGG